MSLLSENVIPGNHGKVFGTDATEPKDLERIKKNILAVKGVKEVVINADLFPKELTVLTSTLVQIKDVEDAVLPTGFHVIPKGLFEL